MKTLETHFRHDKFDFTQLFRERDVAIFIQMKEGQSPAFEVIRVQNHGAAEFSMKNPKTDEVKRITIEAGEDYPRSEDWGTHGWTFRSEAEAMQKAQELLAA